MRKTNLAFISAITIAALCISGCGSSGSSYAKSSGADMAYEAAAPSDDLYAYDNDAYAEEAVADDGGTAADRVEENAAANTRKLIRNYSVNAETSEFDAFISAIESKVEELGGYIEDASLNSGSLYYEGDFRNRDADYTIRIPASNMKQFLSLVGEQSNVTYRSENVSDVTLSYVDLASHKKALEEEQERLYDLMEKAEDIDELIVLQNRLTEVRYQIESMESQLRTYDNQVEYSTLHLNVSEVQVYTPTQKVTTAERIKTGFNERLAAIGEGFSEFGIWIVIHLPDLILVLIIVVVIIIIVRICIHSSRKRAEKKRRLQMETYLWHFIATGSRYFV